MTEQRHSVRAISLWQPWGSLWLSPAKEHETRHWATDYRGLLLVHATKRFVRDIDGALEGILVRNFGQHWKNVLPTGALLGVVDLIGCKQIENMPDGFEATDDYECGDFSPDRFAWKRGAFKKFEQPIPYLGAQSFFSVPTEFLPADWNRL